MKYRINFELGHGIQTNYVTLEESNGQLAGIYDSCNPDFGEPKAIDGGEIVGDTMTVLAHPSRALFKFEGKLDGDKWEGEISVIEENGPPPGAMPDGMPPMGEMPGGPGRQAAPSGFGLAGNNDGPHSAPQNHPNPSGGPGGPPPAIS